MVGQEYSRKRKSVLSPRVGNANTSSQVFFIIFISLHTQGRTGLAGQSGPGNWEKLFEYSFMVASPPAHRESTGVPLGQSGPVHTSKSNSA